MVEVAEASGLPPGMASKLFGVCNFLETGMFGRVGRGGLNHIKQRQFEKEYGLTEGIRVSFQLIKDLLSFRPRREYLLEVSGRKRAVVATDAAYERGEGRAGYLLVLQPGRPQEERKGANVLICPSLYSVWGRKETYICQLELFTMLAAILLNATALRDGHSLWFIDNVPALMAMVNGTSPSPTLEHMAKVAHLMLFALRAQAYFEYIESGANWADEISREGLQGPWAEKNGFACVDATVPTEFLLLPTRALILLCEFL
jgi:hypothetical protein